MASIKLKEDIRSKMKGISQWDPVKYPITEKLDLFLRKSGYRLASVLPVGEEKTATRAELVVEPLVSNYLHPEISYESEAREYQVEVKSYGYLAASDVEEIIEGYNTALAVIDHLIGVDMDAIFIEHFDTEESNKDEE